MRIPHRVARGQRALNAVALAILVAACGGVQLGSRPAAEPTRPQQAPTGSPRSGGSGDAILDAVAFRRQQGLIAHGAPMPFTGSAAFAASARADSSHVLIALSLATGSLTFRREGDQHRADYRVTLTLKNGESVVSRVEATETIRVATIRETQRADESVLFQQLMTAVPGAYMLTVAVRDEASSKAGTTEIPVTVPAFGQSSVSTPMAYYEVQHRASREALPLVVLNPRAVATYGRDSTIGVYVEAYGGSAEAALNIVAQVDSATVWSQRLEPRAPGAGIVTAIADVPLARIGIGMARVLAWKTGGTDTAKSSIFVGLGDEIPATTFDDMVSHLRYFASQSRIRALQAATPSNQATAWATFFRETDPSPQTTVNEALQAYIDRIRHANGAFGEETTLGWRTDRGMVYLLLGPPDAVVDPVGTDPSQRGRALVWEYRSHNLSVEFVRIGTLNQWRLTQTSQAQVWAAARRISDAGQ